MEWKFTEDNPLRVVTLCSGYDSQLMAIRNLGIPYDCIGWSEIDKYAIMAHNAVFPELADKNLGDMTKIDWSVVPDFDLLFYSTPCFTEGTMVLTPKGFVPIEKIEKGDMVLTHTGEYKPVVKPMITPHFGEIININAMPFDKLSCTPNHPFLVRRMKREWQPGICRYHRVFSEPSWVEAKDLSKETYLGVPIMRGTEEMKLPEWNGTTDNRWGHNKKVNKLSDLFVRKAFWYLMGRYVGDGWTRENGLSKVVTICCGGRNEAELTKAISDCGFNATVSRERTVAKYHISSKELVAFVDRYGHYAYGKRVDGETLALPCDLLASFLLGYEHSDGGKVGRVHKVATVSRELAYGIGQCVAKVHRRPFKIYHTKRMETTMIEGRKVRQRDSYQVCWIEERGKQDHAFYENGYLWVPIKSIERTQENCYVYNMEVEDDHSYTANGVAVHNCTDFSNAGKQAGGEEGSGTRSSILWYTRHAIIEKKPTYLVMENVKALVSGKFIKLFRKWLDELTSYGYTNFCKVLNAKDYGIPQNRERIFVVSILGDAWFNFPQPVELKLRLKDMLEEKVAEKYYLAQDKVDKFISELDEDKRMLLENE